MNLNDNMKLYKILLKLNLLSLNILINLALILGIQIKNKIKNNNKDLIITEMIKYLKSQNEKDIDNFQNILETNIPINNIDKGYNNKIKNLDIDNNTESITSNINKI